MSQPTMMISEFREKLAKSNSPLLIGPLAKEIPEISHDFKVFVDGGTKLRTPDSGPSISAGDADSHSDQSEIDFLIKPEKDFSDLAFVLRNLPDELEKLDLVGFLGGRIDHQLAVFGEIRAFIRETSLAFVSLDNDEVLILNRGSHTKRVSGRFSIISLEPQMIRLIGDVKYPIDPSTKVHTLSSFGISNEASGIVKMECEQPLVLVKGSAVLD